MKKIYALLSLLILIPSLASADLKGVIQNPNAVLSSGSFTAGHCLETSTTGSSGIKITDAGAACGSGGGSPGGSPNNLQYNLAGAFAGIPGSQANSVDSLGNPFDLYLTRTFGLFSTAATNFVITDGSGCDNCYSNPTSII